MKEKEKDIIQEIVCYEEPIVKVTTFDEKDHIMTSGNTGAWDWLEHES